MRALLSLTLVPLAAVAPAQTCGTTVQGTASGVWTAAGSPYCVTATTTVPVGATLTIDPGVDVVLSPEVELIVAGTLTVRGAPAQAVRFTAANPNLPWAGLRFTPSSTASALAHCRIERAGDSGVTIDRCLPVLTDCVVTGCSSPLRGGGLRVVLDRGDLQLTGLRTSMPTPPDSRAAGSRRRSARDGCSCTVADSAATPPIPCARRATGAAAACSRPAAARCCSPSASWSTTPATASTPPPSPRRPAAARGCAALRRRCSPTA